MKKFFLVSSILLEMILLSSEPVVASRFYHVPFICKSIDPTGSQLNIRQSPGGKIVGTVSKNKWFYIWGYNLEHPNRGYVPIAFKQLAGYNFDPTKSKDPNYIGYVWKQYITCEILN